MQNDQPYNFTMHAFKNFDFQGKYIPNDLPARGFPISELKDPKFRNYAYAKNMVLMWEAIRSFVSSTLFSRSQTPLPHFYFGWSLDKIDSETM